MGNNIYYFINEKNYSIIIAFYCLKNIPRVGEVVCFGKEQYMIKQILYRIVPECGVVYEKTFIYVEEVKENPCVLISM